MSYRSHFNFVLPKPIKLLLFKEKFYLPLLQGHSSHVASGELVKKHGAFNLSSVLTQHLKFGLASDKLLSIKSGQ